MTIIFKEVPESYDSPLEFMCENFAAFIKPTNYGRLEGWNLESAKAWKADADKVMEEVDMYEPLENEEGLKEWCEGYWPGRYEAIRHFVAEWQGYGWHETPSMLAAWKTSETGHKWAALECRGYSQGDWGSVVYDADALSDEDARRIGAFALGCYSEYARQEDDEDYVYGYFVADTDGNLSDAKTKAYLAECEGVKPEDVRLLKIDGYHKVYDYREV